MNETEQAIRDADEGTTIHFTAGRATACGASFDADAVTNSAIYVSCDACDEILARHRVAA